MSITDKDCQTKPVMEFADLSNEAKICFVMAAVADYSLLHWQQATGLNGYEYAIASNELYAFLDHCKKSGRQHRADCRERAKKGRA